MIGTILASALTIAGAAQPLVVKSNSSGMTLPEYASYESCEIFENQVVLTERMGLGGDFGYTLRETRPIQIDGGIHNVVEALSKEALAKQDNLLCDAPSTSIRSFAGSSEPVVIFESGGCGSPRLERQGPAANMLRRLADRYCPQTNDFGARR